MYAGTNKGGTEAIVAAERLVIERRNATGQKMTPDDIIEAFPLAIDRIMGEGGPGPRAKPPKHICKPTEISPKPCT